MRCWPFMQQWTLGHTSSTKGAVFSLLFGKTASAGEGVRDAVTRRRQHNDGSVDELPPRHLRTRRLVQARVELDARRGPLWITPPAGPVAPTDGKKPWTRQSRADVQKTCRERPALR